jgi:hypothetical protein
MYKSYIHIYIYIINIDQYSKSVLIRTICCYFIITIPISCCHSSCAHFGLHPSCLTPALHGQLNEADVAVAAHALHDGLEIIWSDVGKVVNHPWLGMVYDTTYNIYIYLYADNWGMGYEIVLPTLIHNPQLGSMIDHPSAGRCSSAGEVHGCVLRTFPSWRCIRISTSGELPFYIHM